MAKIKVVRKGESLTFSFDIKDTDPTGFVCTISVRQYPDNSPAIERAIAPTVSAGQTVWAGYLTNAETESLGIGMWILNANIVNASILEEVCIPLRMQITPSWST